jgi:hypothetical protein
MDVKFPRPSRLVLDNALDFIRRRGRAGATAAELAPIELKGLHIAAVLVEEGLVSVTRENRFVLIRYASSRVPPKRYVDADNRCARIPSMSETLVAARAQKSRGEKRSVSSRVR